MRSGSPFSQNTLNTTADENHDDDDYEIMIVPSKLTLLQIFLWKLAAFNVFSPQVENQSRFECAVEMALGVTGCVPWEFPQVGVDAPLEFPQVCVYLGNSWRWVCVGGNSCRSNHFGSNSSRSPVGVCLNDLLSNSR